MIIGVAMTVMTLVGKTFITYVIGCIYIHTSELMPTSIRTLGLASCSLASRIGILTTPYIAQAVFYNAKSKRIFSGVLYSGLI